jgi:hypothetical protein
MSQSSGSGYCHDCQSQVLTTQETPSHVLHLIVAIFTGGIWLPIWFLLAVLPGAKRCTRCGMQLNKGSQRFAVFAFVMLITGGAIFGVLVNERKAPAPIKATSAQSR